MRGTFNVEEKTVAPVFPAPGRGGRRVARRPQRQTVQRARIGRFVERARLQVVGFRPRVSQRLAEHQFRRLGRFVHGGDARSADSSHDKNERPIRLDGFFQWLFRLRGEKA